MKGIPYKYGRKNVSAGRGGREGFWGSFKSPSREESLYSLTWLRSALYNSMLPIMTHSGSSSSHTLSYMAASQPCQKVATDGDKRDGGRVSVAGRLREKYEMQH